MGDQAAAADRNDIRIRHDAMNSIMFHRTRQHRIAINAFQRDRYRFGRAAREQNLAIPVECCLTPIARIFECGTRASAFSMRRRWIRPTRQTIGHRRTYNRQHRGGCRVIEVKPVGQFSLCP